MINEGTKAASKEKGHQLPSRSANFLGNGNGQEELNVEKRDEVS